MRVFNLFNKLFVGGSWTVGIREINSDKREFKAVPTQRGEWLADPFLYEIEGEHYLFVEQYFENKNRAALSCCKLLEEGGISDLQLIIERPYHMSYPCVFYYEGEHYMIPESSANQSLDLFKSTSFPYKWELFANLKSKCNLVDTTVYKKDNTIFLISYESVSTGWDLIIFSLDMKSPCIHRKASVHYKDNVGRPAGYFFEKDGHLYRPAQNCGKKYGESLLIYEVKELSETNYIEEFAYEISVKDVKMDVPFHRIHTLNSDTQYEVIDAFQEKFDLFHGWKIFKRHYLKK